MEQASRVNVFRLSIRDLNEFHFYPNVHDMEHITYISTEYLFENIDIAPLHLPDNLVLPYRSLIPCSDI